MRACDITLDRLNHYVSERMASGIAPATAKLELTHLHKAFRLAERAGKVICPPFPQITVWNVRTGFFERANFEAVRSHLPDAFKGPITFACLTGWRVPSEILTLRWKQVDFSAGMVRLEQVLRRTTRAECFPLGCCRNWRTCYGRNGNKPSRWNWRRGRASRGCSIGTTEARSRRSIRRRSTIGWKAACRLAGVPMRIPHDFRRTAVRNLERGGAALGGDEVDWPQDRSGLSAVCHCV
jgi:integrase